GDGCRFNACQDWPSALASARWPACLFRNAGRNSLQLYNICGFGSLQMLKEGRGMPRPYRMLNRGRGMPCPYRKWMVRVKLLFGLVLGLAAVCAGANVRTMRVPEGGIQPQVAVDEGGAVHLLYYRGDEAHGDLFYAKSMDGGGSFSKPMRVN